MIEKSRKLAPDTVGGEAPSATVAGRQFEFVLNELSRRMRRVYNRLFQEAGLSSQQAAVLLFLDQFGPQSQNELADRMELGKAATAALVARMEAGGFVSRATGKTDRRVRDVDLTDASRAVVARIDALGVDLGLRLREGTTREERRIAIGVLLRMKENLRAVEQGYSAVAADPLNEAYDVAQER